jgi:hypothetical protein
VTGMAPLTGILLGMVIAAFDFRVSSVDIIADPVGWILIAIFAGRLAKANRWFGWTRAIAWTGALFAVPDMFGIDTEPTFLLALNLLTPATLFALLTGMVQRLGPEHPATRWANLLRWAIVVGGVVTAAGLLTVTGTTAGLAVAAVVFIILACVVVGFLVLALLLRDDPQLQATG